jgi:hypothetical protein
VNWLQQSARSNRSHYSTQPSQPLQLSTQPSQLGKGKQQGQAAQSNLCHFRM